MDARCTYWGKAVRQEVDAYGHRGLRRRAERAFRRTGGHDLGSQIGGELKGLTKTLVETRNQAMERLVEQAGARGANPVLMFRFDVTEAADVGTEVCAYGTAVVITKE